MTIFKVMRRFILVIPLIFLLTLSSFIFSHHSWTVVADKATVHFKVPKRGHEGTFAGLEATIDFDGTDLALAKISASVDVNTVKTGYGMLNEHLKTADYFDAKKHPRIKFVSTSFMKTDTGYVVDGKLTMRDSTHVVRIPFTFSKQTFKGNFKLRAGDYGVGDRSNGGKDLVYIDLEIPVQ